MRDDTESVAQRLLSSDGNELEVLDAQSDARHKRGARNAARSWSQPLLSSTLRLSIPFIFCGLLFSLAFWLGFRKGASVPRPAILTPSEGVPCAPAWLDHASMNDHTTATVGSTSSRDTIVFSNGTTFERPSRLKIVGLIFYGRRQFVDILDCYLRRNLAVNGGMLDMVQFVVHTRDKEDQQWLSDLVHRDRLEGQYEIQHEDTDKRGWKQWGKSYNQIWKNLTDPNTIYIKIDDDIVFMDDMAIPEMVRTVLEHPEAHSVVGNVVNNHWTFWYHHHAANAIYPYLADREQAAAETLRSWRPSELPRYSGVLPATNQDWTHRYKPPFDRHRWLPVISESLAEAIARTPYGEANLPQPGVWRFDKDSGAGWAIGAQSHYSFFENLERGLLEKYHFGSARDGTVNNWYSHFSINMMAIRGSYVALKPFWDDLLPEAGHHDDETILTEIVPALLSMPVLIATRAIVSHFSYKGDREEMLTTDILDRYRLYGNEMVCAADNQKSGF